jgi:hypothetical protein
MKYSVAVIVCLASCVVVNEDDLTVLTDPTGGSVFRRSAWIGWNDEPNSKWRQLAESCS